MSRPDQPPIIAEAVWRFPGFGAVHARTTATGLYAIDLRAHGSVAASRHPWLLRLQEHLRAWLDGGDPAWDLPIDHHGRTPFQLAVLRACQEVPHGTTATYGALARRAGHPAAARAAGTVMAGNRLPIVIPCHRITASVGVGGYTPGLDWKRRCWLAEGIPWPG